MYLKSNFIEQHRFDKHFAELSHLPFSLFFEYRPSLYERSINEINFLVLEEPNEYFDNHRWAIENQSQFSAIFTWDDMVLNNCSNALLLPYGESWVDADGFDVINRKHDKKFEISFLRGNNLKTYGHSIRHELYNRRNEISAPISFHSNIIVNNNKTINDLITGKIDVLENFKYNISIENVSRNGYFTEKLIDCFLMRTIPIYWGCSNINAYFDVSGMILVQNVDTLIYECNRLSDGDYESRLESIERNYNIALKYKNYVRRIKQLVIDILELNGIV